MSRYETRRDPGWLALLIAVLRDTPSMPNALCRNRTELFDRGGDEASPDAIELCSHCPEFATCSQWAARQPKGGITGVWAGQVHGPSTRQKSRSTA